MFMPRQRDPTPSTGISNALINREYPPFWCSGKLATTTRECNKQPRWHNVLGKNPKNIQFLGLSRNCLLLRFPKRLSTRFFRSRKWELHRIEVGGVDVHSAHKNNLRRSSTSSIHRTKVRRNIVRKAVIENFPMHFELLQLEQIPGRYATSKFHVFLKMLKMVLPCHFAPIKVGVGHEWRIQPRCLNPFSVQVAASILVRFDSSESVGNKDSNSNRARAKL